MKTSKTRQLSEPLRVEDVEDQAGESFSLFVDGNEQDGNGLPTRDGFDDNGDGVILYNPALRFLMALCGVPIASGAAFMLLFSPIMFGFMHDSPQSNKFPGTIYAFFAFLVYLAFVGLFAYYACLLLTSAWIGQTVYWSIPCCCCNERCQPRIVARSSSTKTGVFLLVPAILVFIAFFF